MEFDNSFYEDEVRDGFYVPAMVKRAWAAELEVLSEIDRICTKYNIRYFADWGTLLACVRHDGFIPWDDDLDIAMLRADYERFLAVCQDEFKDGYEAYNYKNNADYWLYICRVVGRKRICFEQQHLDSFHQFPYIVGVDIFVLDYVSRDADAERARDSLARYAIVTADKVAEKAISGEEAIGALKVIDKSSGTAFAARYNQLWQLNEPADSYKLKMDSLRRDIYAFAETLFAKFGEAEADYITQLFPFGMQNESFRFDKSFYADTIRHRYENTTIPVPTQYHNILSKRYGNYMQLVKNAGAHGYPFFETQHEAFVKLLDFELPSYKYSHKDAVRDKEVASEYFDSIMELARSISSLADSDTIDCELIQEQAILLGNILETYERGADSIVENLEEICENAWAIHEAMSNGQPESVSGHMASLRLVSGTLCDKLRASFEGRRKVVFICYKPEAFYRYAPYIDSYKDDMTDVFILPIPYSYKKYDGSIYASSYKLDGYPSDVKLEDIGVFDLEFLYPDIIYTQQPFDQWNPVTAVEERFYNSSLKHCCKQLVYIPWFKTDDFGISDERQYHNAKNYVLMPGVVCADKVMVQSDSIRQVYLDRLIKWAGEDTADIWESKLEVESTNENCVVSETTASKRKCMVYHVELASFAECDRIIDKIRRSLDIFKQNLDKLDVIWYQSLEFEAMLRKKFPNKYAEYACIRREWMDIIGNGEFEGLSEKDAYSLISDKLDAYYGDGCSLSMLFNIKNKPLMIANNNL